MEKITSYYQGNGLVEAHIGKHRITIDKPRQMGGHDHGPTPIELLFTSLATCVNMVISAYCENHDIDAKGIQVDIRYETDDMQTKVTEVKVNIEIPRGDIQDREEAIAQVAKLCSVHKTIQTLDNIEFSILGRKEIISNIW